MSGGWRRELSQRLAPSILKFDAPLAPLVTLRIGGPADCLIEVESESDLEILFQIVHREGLPFHIFGKGSNLLVPDAGLRGVVLRLGRAFRELRATKGEAEGVGGAGEGGGRREAEETGGAGPGDAEPGGATTVWATTVYAGAGMPNAAFVEACRSRGLGGMEFLVAIPGTIGGAIAMNAGAHDGETASFLRRVRVFHHREGGSEHSAAEYAFGYRSSPLRGHLGWIVLGGEFEMQPMEEPQMLERQRKIQQWRREHHPRDFPNCGSVFKNPPGDYAARLIEEAGLKGTRSGGAQVSEKHANFIVNRGDAKAGDVLGLIDLIRETVYHRTRIELEMEIQILPSQMADMADPG